MYEQPAVVVRKGGFFAALAKGLFAFLITLVVCAAGVGIFALRVVDNKTDTILQSALETLRTGMPEWRTALPPVLVDFLNDKRAPQYRDALEIEVRQRKHFAIVEVTNNGDQTVTLLAARLIALDKDGEPFDEYSTYLATPIMGDDHDLRGPILPGQTRTAIKVLHGHRRDRAPARLQAEITDLRVWSEDSAGERHGISEASMAKVDPSTDTQ